METTNINNSYKNTPESRLNRALLLLEILEVYTVSEPVCPDGETGYCDETDFTVNFFELYADCERQLLEIITEQSECSKYLRALACEGLWRLLLLG